MTTPMERNIERQYATRGLLGVPQPLGRTYGPTGPAAPRSTWQQPPPGGMVTRRDTVGRAPGSAPGSGPQLGPRPLPAPWQNNYGNPGGPIMRGGPLPPMPQRPQYGNPNARPTTRDINNAVMDGPEYGYDDPMPSPQFGGGRPMFNPGMFGNMMGGMFGAMPPMFGGGFPPNMGAALNGMGFDPRAIAANPEGFSRMMQGAQARESAMPGSTMLANSPFNAGQRPMSPPWMGGGQFGGGFGGQSPYGGGFGGSPFGGGGFRPPMFGGGFGGGFGGPMPQFGGQRYSGPSMPIPGNFSLVDPAEVTGNFGPGRWGNRPEGA